MKNLINWFTGLEKNTRWIISCILAIIGFFLFFNVGSYTADKFHLNTLFKVTGGLCVVVGLYAWYTILKEQEQ